MYPLDPADSLRRTAIVPVSVSATMPSTVLTIPRVAEIGDGDVLVIGISVGEPVPENALVTAPEGSTPVFDNLNSMGICGGQQQRTLVYSATANPGDVSYEFTFQDAGPYGAILVAYELSQPPVPRASSGVSNKDGMAPLDVPLSSHMLAPGSAVLLFADSSMPLTVPEPMTSLVDTGLDAFELQTETGEVPARALTIPTGACANYVELTFEP